MPDSSTILSASPVANNAPDMRESAEGATNNVAHTSTPKDDSESQSKLKPAVFNATGHSECLSGCQGNAETPRRGGTRTIRSKALSTRSTEVFCECTNPARCSCSASSSDDNTNREVVVTRNMLSKQISV